jgi:hypothetical protein
LIRPPVIPDLKSLPLPRLYQMEVLVAIDFAEDDVTHFHLFSSYRHNGTELPRIYLALLQFINVNSCPSHTAI